MKRLLIAMLALAVLTGAFTAVRADTAENREIVYEYLTGTLGYSRAAACGIMSNIQYESNFRPDAIGDSGAAYGICQWNSRRQSLINYCERNGFESWQDIYGQLGYLAYELENNKKSVGNYLKNIPDTPKGAYDAGYYFCVHFEIPANRYQKGIKRGSTAVTKYFAMYGGTYETYSVTFDLHGGSGSFAEMTKIEGVPLALSEELPEKGGCTFAGWSLGAASGTPDYQPGDSYEADSAATLHALWLSGSVRDLEFSKTGDALAVSAYRGTASQVRIPSEVDGVKVTAVQKGAFGAVTAVSVPDSVTRIEEGAFSAGTLFVAHPGSYAHSYALQNGFAAAPAFPDETLSLGADVRVIEENAFCGAAFVWADLGSSRVGHIESGAFSECGRLKFITLPDSLTSVAPNALPRDVTLLGREGSYAQSYAAEQGYAFVPIN